MTIHFGHGGRCRLARLALLLGLAAGAGAVQAQAIPSMEGCGPLRAAGQYGPYDYRTDKERLPIVLNAHFTPEVEALIRGHTATKPGSDIAYTLRAIPNNHRALISMVRLGEREKVPLPFGAQYTVECWLSRAINFRPDDVVVRMIYAAWLGNNNRAAEADTQLQVAESQAKDSALTHYNIGLHYFDLKSYDKALKQAHLAAELGWKQPELRAQLESVGKWRDPPASAAADAASAPAPAASAPAAAASAK